MKKIDVPKDDIVVNKTASSIYSQLEMSDESGSESELCIDAGDSVKESSPNVNDSKDFDNLWKTGMKHTEEKSWRNSSFEL